MKKPYQANIMTASEISKQADETVDSITCGLTFMKILELRSLWRCRLHNTRRRKFVCLKAGPLRAHWVSSWSICAQSAHSHPVYLTARFTQHYTISQVGLHLLLVSQAVSCKLKLYSPCVSNSVSDWHWPKSASNLDSDEGITKTTTWSCCDNLLNSGLCKWMTKSHLLRWRTDILTVLCGPAQNGRSECFFLITYVICNTYWRTSLSQCFYPGGTLEIIFRSQGTPAPVPL
jgi:hypothetical protein